MMNCEIICVTSEPFQQWRCIGKDRADAEKYYASALGSWASKPLYRVIVTRKPRLAAA